MEAILFTPGPQIKDNVVIDASGNYWTVLKDIANALAQPREGQYYSAVPVVSAPVEYGMNLAMTNIKIDDLQNLTFDLMAQSSSANINVSFSTAGVHQGTVKATANGKTTEKAISINIKPKPAATFINEPFGAAEEGGVTGGAGGEVKYVTTYAQLKSFAQKGNNTPYILLCDGILLGKSSTVDFGFYCGSNKTIIGLPGSRFSGFGLWWWPSATHTNPEMLLSENCIVRNVTFEKMPIFSTTTTKDNRDYLTVKGGADKFWFDHITFGPSAGADGYIDVDPACTYVTVSYCDLPDEDKCTFVNAELSTVAFNFFRNCTERQPVVSGVNAHCHLHQNFYTTTTSTNTAGYGCSVRDGATCRTVKNRFRKFKMHPFRVQLDYISGTSGPTKPVGSFAGIASNTFIESGTNQLSNNPIESDWDAPYDYTGWTIADAELENYVVSNAGSGKLTLSDLGVAA